MATFPKGSAVEQIVAPIKGVVEGFSVDQETGALQVLVSWTDAASGEVHSRYFTEDQLQAVSA